MPKRLRFETKKPEVGGSYFAAPSPGFSFIHTGCHVLDCVISGGWGLGRIGNIVGDKSTGKSLLAIEACANFAFYYPRGLIRYRESESAFDKGYAKALGMPLERVDMKKKLYTVEDFYDDLNEFIDVIARSKQPGLYILDSLDALSDAAELDREFSEATFGAGKAKQMSQLFRRLVQRIEQNKISVLIISQVRDKIGVSFGRKVERSGGRALDFYASQVLFLAHIGTLTKQIRGIKRPTGITIRAKCDKNKIGLPLRECDMDIEFGFGIDDVTASVNFLHDAGRLAEIGITGDAKKGVAAFLAAAKNLDSVGYRELATELGAAATMAWRELDTEFLPKRSKYAG